MHNLRGYNSHLIIKKALEIKEQIGNRKIDGIPNSNEKFMSFSIGNLKFIDLMQFMQSSLKSLVNNLYDKEDKNTYFTNEKGVPRSHRFVMSENIFPMGSYTI